MIATIAGLGITATALGQRVFGLDPFPPQRLLLLLLNFILLQLAAFGITLAFSSFGREAGRVAFAGVLVALLSYLIQAIAALWPRAAWIGPYSLHFYYDPREVLVNGTFAPFEMLLLAGVFAAAATIAFRRYQTRDLP
jgi:hypothetical protein